MNSLQCVLDSAPNLPAALDLACRWLSDVAQVRGEQLTTEVNELGLGHTRWKGAIRGEYAVARKTWTFFAPVWHTAQAVSALVRAHRLWPDRNYLRAALAGGEFILGNQVTHGADTGFIHAHEQLPDHIFTSAILESIDGLIELGHVAESSRFTHAAVQAARWCRDHAWIPGEGLVRDLYDPASRRFIDDQVVTKDDAPGRPLADDTIFLKMFHLTGEERFRQAFYEIIERLIRDEHPAGNWSDYGPCRPATGECHPRHAYWWGMPMLDAWQDSKDERYLKVARRCGEWYVQAQRNDGGLFRYTDHQFKTDSFGHATSGIACAAILWLRLFEHTGETRWLEPMARAMKYCLQMQFTHAADPNLNGCILEKLTPPDGSDDSPYYIRDLGTIFFAQAAAGLIEAASRPNPFASKVTVKIAAARRPYPRLTTT